MSILELPKSNQQAKERTDEHSRATQKQPASKRENLMSILELPKNNQQAKERTS
jgi:hypothetical protein